MASVSRHQVLAQPPPVGASTNFLLEGTTQALLSSECWEL